MLKKPSVFVAIITILSLSIMGAAVFKGSSMEPAFNVGMVTFTMDDGHKGQYTNAFPILSSRNIPATVYVISDRIENEYYVTVAELQQMVASGWEVGGHGEFPLTGMDDTQLEAAVKTSKQALVENGFNPASFAYPWGRYDDRVVSVMKKYYETALHVSSTGLPYAANELSAGGNKPWTQFGRYHIQGGSPDAILRVLQSIDQAIVEKSWMIFFFHNTMDDGTVDPGQYPGPALDQIADYVRDRVRLGVLKAVTFSEGWNIWKGTSPPPPSPEIGTLNCDAAYNSAAVHAGCRVYYGNILVASGTTPFSIQLIPGDYTIKGSYLGLQSEETAQIQSEGTVPVTLQFTGDLPPTLLLNPSFEIWTSGKSDYWNIDWNRPNIRVAQSTDVYEGQSAADISSPLLYNGINQKRLISELGVSVGEKVTISGWLKNVAGVQKARVAVRFYDAAGSQIGFGAYQAVSLATSSWTESQTIVVVPTNTNSIQIQIHATAWISDFVQGVFRADAIYLIKA